jgi:hypothetical protein
MYAFRIVFQFFDDAFDVGSILAICPVAFARHAGTTLAAAFVFSPSFVGMVLANPAQALANRTFDIGHEVQALINGAVPKEKPSLGRARAGVSREVLR